MIMGLHRDDWKHMGLDTFPLVQQMKQKKVRKKTVELRRFFQSKAFKKHQSSITSINILKAKSKGLKRDSFSPHPHNNKPGRLGIKR
jgi:hypothetical protein